VGLIGRGRERYQAGRGTKRHKKHSSGLTGHSNPRKCVPCINLRTSEEGSHNGGRVLKAARSSQGIDVT